MLKSRTFARRTACIVLAAAMSVASSTFGYSFAAPDGAAPATTSVGVESLKIVITAVQGIVQVRSAEDQPWQRAKEGMTVDENAEFRTSLRSAVQIQIDGGQTITLDRLGTIKVVQAINDNGKFKTNIGMKYGRTRYDIESAGQEHEASISSPSSTLAIRGTKVSLYDQRPWTAQAVSLTGRASFQDSKKKVFFGNKGAGKLKVDVNSNNSAQFALSESVVDPGIALARSESETTLINTVLSTGATLSYDQQKGIKVITGGRPLTDKELVPALPGALNFVLRWTGNANLNLGVISPGNGEGNRTVYPIGGYDVVASGGKIAFDHRGGPKGGIEITSFPTGFPDGSYRIGVAHISGVNTPATVDVFLNGKRIDIINTPDGTTQKTVNFIAEPINPAFGTGIAVGEVRLFPSQDKTAAAGAKVKNAKKGK